MAEEPPPPPIRLMNFVSEEQLDEVKRTRGERVEDGTAQRDRPLFEILKENKDKKDAEFNERFKHRPPKALDEDETEFLDTLEMSRREYEKQLARDEEMQLRSFQAAVAAQSNIVRELKEAPPDPVAEVPKKEQNPDVKKNVHSRPVNVIIKVKPQAKKAKTDPASAEEQPSESIKALDTGAQMAQCKAETPNVVSSCRKRQWEMWRDFWTYLVQAADEVVGICQAQLPPESLHLPLLLSHGQCWHKF